MRAPSPSPRRRTAAASPSPRTSSVSSRVPVACWCSGSASSIRGSGGSITDGGWRLGAWAGSRGLRTDQTQLWKIAAIALWIAREQRHPAERSVRANEKVRQRRPSRTAAAFVIAKRLSSQERGFPGKGRANEVVGRQVDIQLLD